eukprot:SAG11_NODE_1790_length_4255_cov_6.800770_1_plen_381_part_00
MDSVLPHAPPAYRRIGILCQQLPSQHATTNELSAGAVAQQSQRAPPPPPPFPQGGVTVGVLHVAYPLQAVIESRAAELPGIKHVFQESSVESMVKRMGEVDVLMVSGSWDDALLEGASKLKWIQAIGVGYNQFPLETLRAKGIVLSNAVGVNSPAVAEHALALMLSFARKLHTQRDNQHKKHWRPMISVIEDREIELGGRTVCVVGLGAIGEGVARLCKAFGMRVVGTKGRGSDGYRGAADVVYAPEELAEALPGADFVVLCCPLNDATTGLIGTAELGTMKASAVLVNCARGAVVDEAALVGALQDNMNDGSQGIAGAALDVTVEEPLAASSALWSMEQVVITSHTAGETDLYEARLVDIVAENMANWQSGEPFVHRVC